MKTKLWAIALMVICTAFTSSAQLFYKSGIDKLSFNLFSLISNWQIILGLVLYAIGSILFIIALKGGEVTVLYPIIASSYIWVAYGSSIFFEEILNSFRWIGITFIILGIILVNLPKKTK